VAVSSKLKTWVAASSKLKTWQRRSSPNMDTSEPSTLSSCRDPRWAALRATVLGFWTVFSQGGISIQVITKTKCLLLGIVFNQCAHLCPQSLVMTKPLKLL
jgi:hypothetical protein